jgi:hypothetical protein
MGEPPAPKPEPRRVEVGWFRADRPEPWIETEWHCPACGARAVWSEDESWDSDDYYVGPKHVCVACAVVFHLPTDPRPLVDGVAVARLRAAVEALAVQAGGPTE